MSLRELPPPASAPRGTGPFRELAPPVSLPLRHFAFAAAALWVFAAALLWGSDRLLGFDFQARWVLGLTHLLTVGWVGMTLLGALTQMAPVHGGVPLAWPGAAKAAWWLLGAGLAMFVGLLWSGSDAYWLGGALMAAALAVYLVVLGRTYASYRALDWTSRHLLLGLVYLSCLAALGLLLAYDRQRSVVLGDSEGALIAHVHLALVGWVTVSIFGASYRLVGTFGMSRAGSPVAGRVALALLNLGLIGLAADSFWGGRRFMPLWALLLAQAYTAYAWQARGLLAKPRAAWDPPTGFVALALVGGAAWALLGLGLAFGYLQDTTENRAAYVWTALLGWVTPYILGQTHKIVPFLVWLHAYSPGYGTETWKLPTIEDISPRWRAWLVLEAVALGWLSGLAGLLAQSQTWLMISGLFLLAAATVYAGSLAATLSHLARKDERWAGLGGRP